MSIQNALFYILQSIVALFTGADFDHDDRRTNFENTMSRLLELQVLPIINENDTVATDEIRVGDNDTLSAMVAVSIKAALLILLSDIDGLYTSDPSKNKNAKSNSNIITDVTIKTMDIFIFLFTFQ